MAENQVDDSAGNPVGAAGAEPDLTDVPLTVVDNKAAQRFEIYSGGELAAFTRYRREEPATFAFTHTETIPAYAGHGVGSTLVAEVMVRMRAGGYSVLPYCPFVNAYLRKHPEDADLVPADQRRRFGVGS
jgi:predicted GNAT family acetyltransferase